MSIEVTNHIKIYEENGDELPGSKVKKIVLESHWARREFVVLEVEGKTFSVLADDLKMAIENASNSKRY